MKEVSDTERYIDADNFRKTMIKRFGCIPCLTDYSEASRYDIPLDDALNLAPTADVVPKSEYEAVVSAVDNSTQEFLRLHDDYQEAKREVENLKVLLEMTEKAHEGLKELYRTDTDALVEARRKTEIEVARGIFAEIEKIRSKEIHKCETLREQENEASQRKYWEGGYNSLRQLSYWIAELKKKYTEEKHEKV